MDRDFQLGDKVRIYTEEATGTVKSFIHNGSVKVELVDGEIKEFRISNLERLHR